MVSFKVLLSTVALCTTLTAAQASSAQASSAQAPSAEKLKELQALKAAQAAYPKCAVSATTSSEYNSLH